MTAGVTKAADQKLKINTERGHKCSCQQTCIDAISPYCHFERPKQSEQLTRRIIAPFSWSSTCMFVQSPGIRREWVIAILLRLYTLSLCSAVRNSIEGWKVRKQNHISVLFPAALSLFSPLHSSLRSPSASLTHIKPTSCPQNRWVCRQCHGSVSEETTCVSAETMGCCTEQWTGWVIFAA